LVFAADNSNETRDAGSIFIEKYGDCLTDAMLKDIKALAAENIRLAEQIEKTNRAKELLGFFFTNTSSSVAILDKDYNFVRVNASYARADSRDVADYPGIITLPSTPMLPEIYLIR